MHPHVDSRGFQMESLLCIITCPVDYTHVDIASCVGANRGLRRQSAQSISVDTQDEHKKQRETGLKGETKPDLTDVLISIPEDFCRPSVFSQAVDELPHVEVTAQAELCGKRKMHPHVDSRGFQMESLLCIITCPVDYTHVDIASCVGANRGLRRQSAQSISVDTQDEHKKQRETGLKGETKPYLTDVLISIPEGHDKNEFKQPHGKLKQKIMKKYEKIPRINATDDYLRMIE
nr:hypothetical protein [Tanacetum cinerariifolium]